MILIALLLSIAATAVSVAGVARRNARRERWHRQVGWYAAAAKLYDDDLRSAANPSRQETER